MVMCEFRNGCLKERVFERDWISCSKLVDYFKLNVKHNWWMGGGGGLYDYLNEKLNL